MSILSTGTISETSGTSRPVQNPTHIGQLIKLFTSFKWMYFVLTLSSKLLDVTIRVRPKQAV